MIILPFVSGTFASTVEYCIRNFTEEYKDFKITSELCSDGSMHSFKKLKHITKSSTLHKVMLSDDPKLIVTPIYPFTDLDTYNTLNFIVDNKKDNSKIVLLYVDGAEYAEINMLFQYYKISIGLNLGLDIFCNGSTQNILGWDDKYTNWQDMQPWELREWLSFFYVKWISEWSDLKNYTNIKTKISSQQMLEDPKQAIEYIIKYCNLTLYHKDELDKFLIEWQKKQQYVLDEYKLINDIVSAVLDNTDMEWNTLNIISEAIIQQHLRQFGFNIKCYMLNEFPVNANALRSLLEHV